MRRERRLPGGAAFEAVFREGAVVNSPFFVVRFRPNDGRETRWGVAVGKKLAPHAVDRNYLRRRIKSILTELDAGPLDAVVVAKTPILGVPYAELSRSLATAARRMAKEPNARRSR